MLWDQTFLTFCGLKFFVAKNLFVAIFLKQTISFDKNLLGPNILFWSKYITYLPDIILFDSKINAKNNKQHH